MRHLWHRDPRRLLALDRRGGVHAPAGHDHAPRAGRLRHVRRAGRRAGTSPAEHRGREPRRAADGERGWIAPADLQRRGVQPPDADGAAAGRRRAVPHALRHRDGAARVRAARRGGARGAARHVRVRDVGSADADADAGARPLRREAAVLRAARRRDAGVRLGDEGDPRERDGARRRCARTPCPTISRITPRRAKERCSRGSSDCCRATRSCGATARSARGATGTCVRGRGGGDASRRGADRGVSRPAQGSGAAAADGRRAARRLPLRRDRLGDDHGAHEPARRRADQDLLGGIRRARGERAGVRADRGEGVQHGSPRGARHAASSSSVRCRRSCGTRTSRSRIRRAWR